MSITGDSNCPDPQQVAARVQQITGDQLDAARLNVQLRVVGDQLSVSLFAADGAELATRSVPLDPDCTALAQAAAVLLVTWISDEHPEFLNHPALPATPTAPLPTPSVVPSVVPSAAPAPAPPPVPVPVPALSASASRAASPPASARRLQRLAIAVGAGATFDANGAVFGGALSAAWDPVTAGLGVEFSVHSSLAQSVRFSDQSLRYFRWPALVGPFFRFRAPSVMLDLQGGAGLAWFHVAGAGFARDSSASDLSYAAFLGVRILPSSGRLRPFLQVAPIYWLKAARARQRNPDFEQALPRAEMRLEVGLRW